MDKKKVKELMEDILLMVDTIEGFDDGDTEQLLNVKHKLNEVLEELSKSDWVSVEDGLPEYMKNVVICDAKYPDNLLKILLGGIMPQSPPSFTAQWGFFVIKNKQT